LLAAGLLNGDYGEVMNTRSTAVGTASLVLLLALPASGQSLPGAPRTDWDRVRAEYTTSVLRDFNTLMTEWRDHLQHGDAGKAAALYETGAQLLINGHPVALGRDSVGVLLARFAPGLIEIRTALTDFVASDYLAYATGPVIYIYREPGSTDVRSVKGTLVTFMVRDGRRWRIRSQVLQRGV
jgi:hypothetical protein